MFLIGLGALVHDTHRYLAGTVPSFERCTRKFLGSVPKSRGRRRVAGLGNDEGRCWGASQFADSTGAVVGAWLCFRACRREQDWSGSVRRRMPEEWGREIGRKRKQTARAAREQAGAGKSRMSRIAGQ